MTDKISLNLRRYTYITILAIILLGCDKRPKGVLSDSQMVDFLTDMSVAEAIQQSAAGGDLPDSVRRRIGYSVMKAHGIDRKTLDSTYAWYSKNVDNYYDLYEKVEQNINKELKRSGVDEHNGLDNNIWNLQSHIVFSPVASTDVLVFRMPGSAVGKGEKLQWRMTFNKSTDAGVSIGIDYDDGTTSLVNRAMRGDRNLDISVIADTARTPQRVFGTLRIKRNVMPVFADSVCLLRFPFDSTEFKTFRYQKFLTGPRKRTDKINKNDDLRFSADTVKSATDNNKISPDNSMTPPADIIPPKSNTRKTTSSDKLNKRRRHLSSEGIPGYAPGSGKAVDKKSGNKKRL